MRHIAWMLALGACGAPQGEDPIPEEEKGACGDRTTHDVTVLGRVVDVDGQGIESATVDLEDRGWNDGEVLGTATTAADGSFTMSATDVTSIEGCWGTMLDYVLVAEQDGRSGEKGINSQLRSAISDESFEADVSSFPVTLE